jgi:hypothetical protein
MIVLIVNNIGNKDIDIVFEDGSYAFIHQTENDELLLELYQDKISKNVPEAFEYLYEHSKLYTKEYILDTKLETMLNDATDWFGFSNEKITKIYTEVKYNEDSYNAINNFLKFE